MKRPFNYRWLFWCRRGYFPPTAAELEATLDAFRRDSGAVPVGSKGRY